MAPNSSDRAALKWIYRGSRNQHIRLVLLTVGNAANSLLSVAFALMCRGIVDSAAAGDGDGITVSALWLAGTITAMLILRLACSSTSEYIKASLERDMRQSLFKKLLGKEFENTSAYHSGELLNRMFSDIAVVSDGVTGLLPSLVSLVTRLAGAAVVLLVLDPAFTLLFICAGAVLFTVSLLLRRRIKHLHKEVQSAQGEERSFLQECLENLLAVKSFGAQDKMLAVNAENQQRHFSARMKRRAVTILANGGFGFVFQAGYLYAIAWGAFKILDGVMSYGTLTAILQLVNQIQQPFAQLSSLLPRFYGMTASAERIMELEGLPDEPQPEKRLSYDKFAAIKISGMDFAYGNTEVLKNVDISIEKGDFVSLSGISGGGKSTLFLLLLGAYRQRRGEIAFRSTEGTAYSAGGETRSLIAYVPQGNILFSGTVRENITLLSPSATEEELLSAAEAACVTDFISALPDGMDTRVGENGFGISEGQAQRIAVARAILSGAPIMLLDEATSALDEETEAALLRNISQLRDRTVLIVTHRRAALDICSKHLVLRDGALKYTENV